MELFLGELLQHRNMSQLVYVDMFQASLADLPTQAVVLAHRRLSDLSQAKVCGQVQTNELDVACRTPTRQIKNTSRTSLHVVGLVKLLKVLQLLALLLGMLTESSSRLKPRSQS